RARDIETRLAKTLEDYKKASEELNLARAKYQQLLDTYKKVSSDVELTRSKLEMAESRVAQALEEANKARAALDSLKSELARVKEDRPLLVALLSDPNAAPLLDRSIFKSWTIARDLGLRKRVRPLKPGVSIGLPEPHAGVGSICCFVRDRKGDKF